MKFGIHSVELMGFTINHRGS